MLSSAMVDLTNLRIEHASDALRSNGALDVAGYEQKLRNNSVNPDQVINHLSEARVALMFIGNGAKVWMRESPDLMIEWFDEVFYAEVKHFLRKQQDEIDEQATKNTRDVFVRVGDTFPIEKRNPWEQVSDVARKKKSQYIDGSTNILVIDSSSESLQEMAMSAANEYSGELRRAPSDLALRRLHGIMITNVWGLVGGGVRNVDFAPTRYAVPRMSYRLAMALSAIRIG